jgi:hypothetical protein
LPGYMEHVMNEPTVTKVSHIHAILQTINESTIQNEAERDIVGIISAVWRIYCTWFLEDNNTNNILILGHLMELELERRVGDYKIECPPNVQNQKLARLLSDKLS